MSKLKTELREMRKAFAEVHAHTLAVLKLSFEAKQGAPLSPYAWLAVISQDPAYAWLKPLHQALLETDILLEQEVLTAQDLAALLDKILGLLTAPTGTPFGGHFQKLMQDEPDLILAYAPLKKALAKLPADPPASERTSTSELSRLTGEWTILEMVDSGTPVDFGDAFIRIEGPQFQWITSDYTFERKMKIDPQAVPSTVDLTITNLPQRGAILHGIYRLDQNFLVICHGPTDKPRPKEFQSTAENKAVLFITRRKA